MKNTLKILIGAVIVGVIVPAELYIMSMATTQRYMMDNMAGYISPTLQWLFVILVAVVLAVAGLKLIYDGIRD